MRVLVVDDNHDAADALVQLLKMELGCDAGAAYDGRSAVDKVLSKHHHVLILDVCMPELSGIDVVREIDRAHRTGVHPNQPELCLAVTGNDATSALGDIDRCFDGAFAKPVDSSALVNLLRSHWSADAPTRPSTANELSDLLCQVARKSGPMLSAAGHVLSFDYQGPRVVVDSDAAAVHMGLHRLLCGIVDMVGSGFVVFKAAVQAEPSGEYAVVVHIAATGPASEASLIDAVLARLELADLIDHTTAGASARTAVGTCPRSGAAVHCLIVPSDGVMFRFELRLRPLEVLDARPDARGARAWIVDPQVVPSALLQRRLQRLGWQVRRYDSFAEAQDHATRVRAESMPALLIIMDAVQDAAVADLRAVLSPSVRCLRVVPMGSTALGRAIQTPLCDLRVDPISPGELVSLTDELHRPSHEADAGLPTASTALSDRPRLLVVDDVEVNRIVASGLAAALGYEVATVADGLDAIQHCKLTPPDVVLMDINMPVVGGVEATERIRHLQKLGEVPPFPVIASTASDDQATRDRCHSVGMDGFVSKPLALKALAEELRRVTLNAPA